MANDIPDISIEYDDDYNPTITSPNAEFGLSFYQTKYTLMDVDLYKRFLQNAIRRFRTSVFYTNYKSYLMDLGLDRCQIMPGITSEIVGAKGIEMNHNFLTIFDIALLITEHTINTKGQISTFDLVQLLKEEHKANRIPIVMLCKTIHQIYHNEDDIYLPAQMCFGYWVELLQKYNQGITKHIAMKTIDYINHSINNTAIDAKTMSNMIELQDQLNEMEGWSGYNEYGDYRRIYAINTHSGENE